MLGKNKKNKKYNEISYDSTVYLSKRIIKENIIPNLWEFLKAVFFMVVIAGTTAALAYLIQPALDEIFLKKDKTWLALIPLAVISVSVIRGFATYYQVVIMKKLSIKVTQKMQLRVYSHTIDSDMSIFSKKSSGKMMTNITSDVGNMMGTIDVLLTGVMRQLITAVFLIGVMFSQSVELSLITLVGVPLVIYPIYLIGRKLRKLSHKNQEEMGQFTTIMSDTLSSARLIKSYNREDFEKKRMADTLSNLRRIMLKMVRFGALVSPMMEAVSGVGIGAVILYGGLEVISGATTAGTFFSFIAAVMMAYRPIKSLSGINQAIQQGLASANRLYRILDEKPKVADKENAVELENVKGNINFNNVKFSYNENEIALDGVTLEIPKGKTVALVGHSGGGKSTIMNLILRFYDVNSGSVCIDDYDVRDVTIKSLRDSMAIVSQEVTLFDESVKENIRYGRLEATDEEVFEAARLAAADDFISQMPNGYNTKIGQNGLRISGGQRQRISIARAILRNAPILLLDEATSALDPISERLIKEALDKLMVGRTTLVIAHRLSTVINADIIYVISGGKVSESGTHGELIKKGGEYAGLYAKQFESK